VTVAVAGRVMARRVMGKLAFVSLRDGSGTIQLYVDKSRLQQGAEGMKMLKNLVDTGDFVGVRGGLRRTDKGELSVVAASLEVRPLRLHLCALCKQISASVAVTRPAHVHSKPFPARRTIRAAML
jgi:lysyl-tRNA synthetase class II